MKVVVQNKCDWLWSWSTISQLWESCHATTTHQNKFSAVQSPSTMYTAQRIIQQVRIKTKSWLWSRSTISDQSHHHIATHKKNIKSRSSDLKAQRISLQRRIMQLPWKQKSHMWSWSTTSWQGNRGESSSYHENKSSWAMIDLEAQFHIKEYENFIANITPQNTIFITNLFN
jgi:hypothetical protein